MLKYIVADVAAMSAVAALVMVCTYLNNNSANAGELNESIVSDGVILSSTSHANGSSSSISDTTMSIYLGCEGRVPEVKFDFPATLSNVSSDPKSPIAVRMRLNLEKYGPLSGITNATNSSHIRDYMVNYSYDRSAYTDFRNDMFLASGMDAVDLARHLMSNDKVSVSAENLKITYNFNLHGFADGARYKLAACTAL